MSSRSRVRLCVVGADASSTDAIGADGVLVSGLPGPNVIGLEAGGKYNNNHACFFSFAAVNLDS